MKRLDQLTFTRFIALFLVLSYHGVGGAYLSWLHWFPALALLAAAPTAVSYLYVLSGFVLSLVYHRPQQKFDVRSFWIARFVRIYPLYIIAFLLVCFYYGDATLHIKPAKIVANIFVAQAWWPAYSQSFNYASWSMTVEFFFYFIFPFFTLWAYRRGTRFLIWFAMLFWGISQSITFILWTGYYPAWQFFLVYNPIFHLSSFLLGTVGGIWFLRAGQGEKIAPLLNTTFLVLSTALAAGYTVVSTAYPALPHDLQPMSGLLAPFFVLTISTLALDRTRISNVLNHPWLVALGETAFALYILHVPVVWLYYRWVDTIAPSNASFIIDVTTLPMMIAVGLLANKFIDPPIRRWLKSLVERTNVSLFLLELLIFCGSVVLSFQFRFGSGKLLASYRNAYLIMFWCAFLLRSAAALALHTTDISMLRSGWRTALRAILGGTLAGSVACASILYFAYLVGWIASFPRSVFGIDFLLVLALSLAAYALTRTLTQKFLQQKALA